HLQRGIPALYWNWEEIGDHLLTPKMKREPIDGRWGDFTACAGAICLAARAADSEIVTEFNGAIILAGPDTMPIDVEADYRNHWDVLREQREAAQACGQLLQ
ncbi:MAG TPA: hypothetical protein VJJ78_02070, partial [Candidatus Saccharimonadales bacterium]|nr:hypothetical protein [Candidatus Saccharimonadales bacterium]